MKKKLIAILLITITIIFFLPIIANADSYTPATGLVEIDASWVPGNFKASVNATGAADNQVVTLKITANATINQTDANYLTGNLTNLEELYVSPDTSFVAIYKLFMNNHPKLKTVTLASSSVAYDSIFSQCDKLETVSLPQVKTVNESAFYHCDKLENVNMPKAETFGGDAFSNCISLKKISLPSTTLFTIDAFQNCTSLSNVSMKSVESFGRSAFVGCISLSKISLASAKSFGNSAFDGCTALKDISLPKATTFGNDAFMNNDALINISLPSATKLGTGVFRRCDLLESASLNALTTLPSFSFITCPELKSVSFKSLTTFEDRIFDGATGAIKMRLGSTIPTTDPASFTNYDPLSKGAIVSVPKGSVLLYDADGGPVDGLWRGFAIAAAKGVVVANPQTGESSNFYLLYIALILVSVLAVTSIIFKAARQ